MLTVVSAVAKQTLAQTRSPQEFASAFDGRIQAMATAYSLVSRENWNEVPLREVITEQLKPHEAGDQVEISGPDVHVKPAAALAMGLVIHELTTNAAKYGSLSRSDGRASITWVVEHQSLPLLVLHWKSSGHVDRAARAAQRPAHPQLRDSR
jgi:two-component sensor histidine kinase